MSDRLRLFQGFGVELEYMIAARDSLDVRPICDELLKFFAGRYIGDLDFERTSWSNELVLHVIELKTNGPARELEPLAALFQDDVARIANKLADFDAVLLPTAMHPWMDPLRETRLWPHDYNPVYEAFNRIFDCRGHGWANLQSTHLNLPFADDEEFGRLHAAIRLVLPLLPALAAASPIADGQPTGRLDQRLEAYRHNADRIPQVAGRIVPEPAYTADVYQRVILEPLYAALRPHDPDGILQEEWANARGAIARFDRGTIEIRVLDVQECPAADLAILALAVELIRALSEERFASLATLQSVPVDPLERTLLDAIVSADQAPVSEVYRGLLGLPEDVATAGQTWRYLFESLVPASRRATPLFSPLATIFEHGCLARRILRATGAAPTRERLQRVYRELSRCLTAGEMFMPTAVAES